MERKRLFVGKRGPGKDGELFYFKGEPTEKTHGHLYSCVIGPFRTKAAALLMASPWSIISHVSEAEKIAKLRREV